MFKLLRMDRPELKRAPEMSAETTTPVGWLSLLVLDWVLIALLFNVQEPFGALSSLLSFLCVVCAIGLAFWHFNKFAECVARS